MKSLKHLRKSLLWDTFIEKLDYQKDSDFIIGRILDFGNLKEWKLIKSFYGLPKIKRTAEKHIFSDPRSANFWSIILKIPLKKIKCTRKPLLKTPKTFSAR